MEKAGHEGETIDSRHRIPTGKPARFGVMATELLGGHGDSPTIPAMDQARPRMLVSAGNLPNLNKNLSRSPQALRPRGW